MNTSDDLEFVRNSLVVVEYYLREKELRREDVVHSASILEDAVAALLKVSAVMTRKTG